MANASDKPKNPVGRKTKSVKRKTKKTTKAVKKVTTKVTPKKAKKRITKVANKKITKASQNTTKKKPSPNKKAGGGKRVKVVTNDAEQSNIEQRIEQLQSMLQANLKGLNGDKAEAMAKNIWLAGLGAYARTYEELSGRYDDIQARVDDINAEGQKVFSQLVNRGQQIQDDLDQAVDRGRESLEDRVEQFKHRFGGGLSSFIDIPDRLREAAERVEKISKKLRKKD